MIPLIHSEPGGGAAGRGASRPDVAGDGAIATAFGDLLAPADDATVDVAVTAEATAAISEAEGQDPGMTPADQPTPDEEMNVLAVVGPDAPKDAKSGSEIAIVPRKGKDTDVPSRASVLPPETSPARVGTTSAGAVEARLALPSVAQTVLEGRLPQVALSPIAQSRLSTADLPDMPGRNVAALSGNLPKADRIVAAPADQLMTPGSPAGTAFEDSGHLRRADPQRSVAVAESRPAPPIAAPPQPPAVAIAQGVAPPQRGMTENDPRTSDRDIAMSPALAERSLPAASAQGSAAVSAPPETARNAASQIAVAIADSGGKTTEITLNPEELGRVRLSLAADENAIVLNITAERSETQELLRRYLDQLAQEFRQLGYTSVSFTFGDQKGEGQPDVSPPEDRPEQMEQEAISASRMNAAPTRSGLDLRI